jgi:hypothetical protein
MKYKLLLLNCIATLGSVWASANGDTPGTGEDNVEKNDIVGGVFHNDTKKPINNVSVTAYASNKKEKIVLTDVNGNFSFDDLKPGAYKFVFEKDGYRKITREKIISRIDEAYSMNITMEEHASFDFMPGPSHFFEN